MEVKAFVVQHDAEQQSTIEFLLHILIFETFPEWTT